MKRTEPVYECDPDLDRHLDAGKPILPAAVERLEGRRWRFVPSAAETSDINETMVRARESWERGDEDGANTIIHDLAARYPNNMQALTHVASFFDASDFPDAAAFFWKRAFDVGRAGLSSDFFTQGNMLPSEFCENRAFLEAFVQLTRMSIQEKRYEEAIEALAIILELDPADAFEARVDAIFCFEASKRPSDVLRVCEQYPDDDLPEIVFSRILALHQTGRKEEAAARAREAAETHPHVIKQAFHPLRHHPKCDHSPESDAYHYWLDFKRFWIATTGALSILKGAQREAKNRR